MANIHVAVVLLKQHILTDLISVYEGIVETELEDKLFQLLLNLASCVFLIVIVWGQNWQRVYTSYVHDYEIEWC